MRVELLWRRLPQPLDPMPEGLASVWSFAAVPLGHEACTPRSPALKEEFSSPPWQTSCSDSAVSSPPPLSSQGGGPRGSWCSAVRRMGEGVCSSTRVMGCPVASLGSHSPRKGSRVEFADSGPTLVSPGNLCLLGLRVLSCTTRVSS